jgi:flagellar biosynthesis protein FliP
VARHSARHGSPHPPRRRTRLRTAPIRAGLFGIATALILPGTALAAGVPGNTDDAPIAAGDSGPSAVPSGAGGSMLRLALGLVVVIGLIAAVWWVMKRVQRSRYPGAEGSGAAVEVVATTALGPNRALHLVRVGDQTILVGATDHAITPVARLDEDGDGSELIARAARDPELARRMSPAAPDAPARFALPDGGMVPPPSPPPAPTYAPPLPTLRERIAAALPPPAPTRRRRVLRRVFVLTPLVVALLCALWPAMAWAAPGITLDLGGDDGEVSTSLQLLALLTVLSLAPSILIMMTSFTRIIIVLGFVRNALGTPQMPPNQVLVGVALFLSLFVMAPTFTQINDQALQPLLEKRIDEKEALKRAEAPIRSFMFGQVDQKDLSLFVELDGKERPRVQGDVPTHVLIPAFVLSELRTAFEIGFLIFIPFLIIDMVVASTVMSMGMVMLPPVVISLPFKILLFVLVDGWRLVSESLVKGFM